MYAGTTIRRSSGNIVGVHQRIDRVAKRHLARLIGRNVFFPPIKTILYFEGNNGPDGLKRKSPGVDEPWHFILPTADASDPLVTSIRYHLINLEEALARHDEVRAGFEAAWSAHAITDGLTPAHHVALAEMIEQLWGKSATERSTFVSKVFAKGDGSWDTFSKNWQYWGGKGAFSTHWTYEYGVASAITTSTFKDIGLTSEDIVRVEREGYIPFFLESLRYIDSLNTYQTFKKTGWTARLSRTVAKDLVPLIIKNVCLAWYAASRGISA